MKPSTRYEWIISHLKELDKYNLGSVDILDKDFLMSYVEATDAKWSPTLIGAPRCPQLAKDLLKLYKDGKLQRHRSGLWNMGGMGFPKWVWTYQLVKQED